MKEEESIKGEGCSERKGLRSQERNTVAIKNQTCNQTSEKYSRTKRERKVYKSNLVSIDALGI